MLNHRMQILLDDERYRRLSREARRRKAPIAEIIREAIDRAVPPAGGDRRRAALAALLAAEPMPVPQDPHALRAELDDAHDRRP